MRAAEQALSRAAPSYRRRGGGRLREKSFYSGRVWSSLGRAARSQLKGPARRGRSPGDQPGSALASQCPLCLRRPQPLRRPAQLRPSGRWPRPPAAAALGSGDRAGRWEVAGPSWAQTRSLCRCCSWSVSPGPACARTRGSAPWRCSAASSAPTAPSARPLPPGLGPSPSPNLSHSPARAVPGRCRWTSPTICCQTAFASG